MIRLVRRDAGSTGAHVAVAHVLARHGVDTLVTRDRYWNANMPIDQELPSMLQALVPRRDPLAAFE